MQRSKATPAQLVVFSVLGSLIVTSAFLVIPAASHYRNDFNGGFFGGSFIAHLVAMLAFVCGGGYLSIWAQRGIKDGIRLDRWADAELRPVRKFFESWVAKVIFGALFGMFFVLFLFAVILYHRNFDRAYWACFALNHGLMSLKFSLATHKPLQPSWLQPSEPLQSEHWGE